MKYEYDEKTMAGYRSAYTTEHEVEFIQKLGSHKSKVKMTREQLLINYLIGSFLRKDWGRIDSKEAQGTAILGITEAQNG